MKIEWLFAAQAEFRDFLTYYLVNVGEAGMRRFEKRILDAVQRLEVFPELGVIKEGTLLGKYGFRAIFIDQYACIYKIEDETVFIYHLVDARTNYIYHIFGVE